MSFFGMNRKYFLFWTYISFCTENFSNSPTVFSYLILLLCYFPIGFTFSPAGFIFSPEQLAYFRHKVSHSPERIGYFVVKFSYFGEKETLLKKIIEFF